MPISVGFNEWLLSGGRSFLLPWPRQCGYCCAEVDQDQAIAHWKDVRGVSRCRLRIVDQAAM